MTRVLIAGGALIVLAVATMVVVPMITAPKGQSEEEMLAAIMQDYPEEIPQSQLDQMTKVRFTFSGYD